MRSSLTLVLTVAPLLWSLQSAAQRPSSAQDLSSHSQSAAAAAAAADAVGVIRFQFRFCAIRARADLASGNLQAQLDAMSKSTSPTPFSWEQTDKCVLDADDKITAAQNDIKRQLPKNANLRKLIDELAGLAKLNLLVIKPNAEETKLGYQRRIEDFRIALKTQGSQIMLIACNNNIRCVSEHSASMNSLEQEGLL